MFVLVGPVDLEVIGSRESLKTLRARKDEEESAVPHRA